MPNFLKYLEWLNTMSCIHYKCARPHVQVIGSVMCASQNKIKIYTFFLLLCNIHRGHFKIILINKLSLTGFRDHDKRNGMA